MFKVLNMHFKCLIESISKYINIFENKKFMKSRNQHNKIKSQLFFQLSTCNMHQLSASEPTKAAVKRAALHQHGHGQNQHRPPHTNAAYHHIHQERRHFADLFACRDWIVDKWKPAELLSGSKYCKKRKKKTAESH